MIVEHGRIIAEIERLGYSCQYDRSRSLFICAERSPDGALSGVSFTFSKPASRWMVSLWSCQHYLIPSSVDVATIAIDILSGHASPPHKTPIELSDEFVRNRELLLCRLFDLTSANNCDRIESALEEAPTIDGSPEEFADLFRPNVDLCGVDPTRDGIALYKGGASCEVGFTEPPGNRRALPILFPDNVEDSAREELLRIIATVTQGVIYGEDGARMRL